MIIFFFLNLVLHFLLLVWTLGLDPSGRWLFQINTFNIHQNESCFFFLVRLCHYTNTRGSKEKKRLQLQGHLVLRINSIHSYRSLSLRVGTLWLLLPLSPSPTHILPSDKKKKKKKIQSVKVMIMKLGGYLARVTQSL